MVSGLRNLRLATSWTGKQCVSVYVWQRPLNAGWVNSRFMDAKDETNHGSSNPSQWYAQEYPVVYTSVVYNTCVHLSIIIKMCLITCHVHCVYGHKYLRKKVASTWRLPKKSSTAVWRLSPQMTRCFSSLGWTNALSKQHIFWCCLLKSHSLYMPRLERYDMRIYILYMYTSYL